MAEISYEEMLDIIRKDRTETATRFAEKQRLRQRKKEYVLEAKDLLDLSEVYNDAAQLLNTVSDKTVNSVLDTVTLTVNSVLAEMFEGTGAEYEIRIVKGMYRGRYAQMRLELMENGHARDLQTQSGDGIKQVISFLFTVLLVSVSGKRRLLILDEVLDGLHKDAAESISQMLNIFARKGFQFIIIDHNNFGRDSSVAGITEFVEVSKINNLSHITQ